MSRGQCTFLCLLCFALTTTAQPCDLTFYLFGSPQEQQRVVFTGLTAEERARSGNTTTGHRLTCACANMERLTPLQWLDVNGAVLPNNRRQQLVDFRVADSQPGSAVNLRVNKAGFSCAEAGNYTCLVGNNTRTALVTPIGEDCSLLPPTPPTTPSPTHTVPISSTTASTTRSEEFFSPSPSPTVPSSHTAGRLLCVSNAVVLSTSCTTVYLSWKEPAHDLSYRIGVCPRGTLDYPYHYTCSGCSSYTVTGLLPSQNYTITVETLGSSSHRCQYSTVIAATKTLTLSCMGLSPDLVDTGILTWMVAALLLLVLLLATAVLAVMVSLCARRCRRNSKKQASPPVPNENCVYYETSELDCVQMQRSPVYATVDEAKYN